MISGHSTHWSYNLTTKTSVKKQNELHPLKDGHIRVKISHFAVHHSDLLSGSQSEEVTHGSQAFGIVEAVTPQQARFKVGDRVALGRFIGSCGQCRLCFKGREHLCSQAVRNGGYSTHVDVRSDWAFSVPRDLPDELVPAVVSDGSAIYSALKHFCKKSTRVGILGSKATAQLAHGFAKALGFEATIIGQVEDKDIFEKTGSAFVDVTTKDVKFKDQFDVLLICNQRLNKEWYAHAITWTRLGGKVFIIGQPIQENSRIPFFDLVAGELQLTTISTGNRQDIYEALLVAANNRIRSNVNFRQFDDVPAVFSSLGQQPYRSYEIVKI